MTLLGTVGLFAFGILLAVRFLPVISMFEMRALLRGHSSEGERDEGRHRQRNAGSSRDADLSKIIA